MIPKKVLGFLAIAGLLFVAAPTKPAHAISLLNPAAAALVQQGNEAVTTEVRWRRGGFRRGGYGYRRFYAPRRFYGRRYFAPRRFYGGPRFYRRF